VQGSFDLEITGREGNEARGISRRSFLGARAALAGGTATLAVMGTAQAQELDASRRDHDHNGRRDRDSEIAAASIAELQAAMASRRLSSVELVGIYLRRIRDIDRGLDLKSIIQLNPDVFKIAAELDNERRRNGPRGPLHGIPVLLKDNIDTADRMRTTAGSHALFGAAAPRDATVTARLRQAGAVILGKANLSEWANFRGFGSSSGWSGVGGQCRNPYILDRNPCGSSSGSGAAVSSALTSVALGTETDGSIVCPSGQCGVAGIKPTVGLTSRAGVVPSSATQDTVGCHGRRLADAGTVLGALTGVDPRDADRELKFFGQELMELAQDEIFDEATYLAALADGPRLGGTEGIDASLANHNVDVIVAPTNSPAWPTDLINGDAFLFGSSGLAAAAGYPLVTVTGGYAFGLPIGITFMASAWSEPTLIRIASGFEAAADVRRRPRFVKTFEARNAQFDGSGSSANGSGGSYWNRTAEARARTTGAAQRRNTMDRLTMPRTWRPTGL